MQIPQPSVEVILHGFSNANSVPLILELSMMWQIILVRPINENSSTFQAVTVNLNVLGYLSAQSALLKSQRYLQCMNIMIQFTKLKNFTVVRFVQVISRMNWCCRSTPKFTTVEKNFSIAQNAWQILNQKVARKLIHNYIKSSNLSPFLLILHVNMVSMLITWHKKRILIRTILKVNWTVILLKITQIRQILNRLSLQWKRRTYLMRKTQLSVTIQIKRHIKVRLLSNRPHPSRLRL